MKKKTVEAIQYPNDGLPSPEDMVKRLGLNPNDREVADAVAAIERAKERLHELSGKKAKSGVEGGQRAVEEWKKNRFYEPEIYDGRDKKMKHRDYHDQRPEFLITEAARKGKVSLVGLFYSLSIYDFDRKAALFAIENVLLPWRPANGGRCFAFLSRDAAGELFLNMPQDAPATSGVRRDRDDDLQQIAVAKQTVSPVPMHDADESGIRTPVPKKLFGREEVIICAYAALYGDADLGGMKQASQIFGRPTSSLRLKAHNFSSIFSAKGIPYSPQFPPFPKVCKSFTNWDMVEPLTTMAREAHLSLCRQFLQRR